MTDLDFSFFAATLAFGWGLSLATYRIFAVRNDWPMGALHTSAPMVPILFGLFALAIASLFATVRTAPATAEFDGLGGWWILPAGLVWAFLWTSLMRTGSQISLLLAPLATVAVMVAWINARTPPSFVLDPTYQANTYTFAHQPP